MDQDNFNVNNTITPSPNNKAELVKPPATSKNVDKKEQDLPIQETPNLVKFHKYKTAEGETIYIQRSTRNRSKKSVERAKKIVEEDEKS
jgi:hypothetical protein